MTTSGLCKSGGYYISILLLSNNEKDNYFIETLFYISPEMFKGQLFDKKVIFGH